MSKYQLERIKDMYSGISDPDKLNEIPVVTVAQSDIEWLIEQAGRVQELETTVDFYQSALRDADRRVQELEEEVERYQSGRNVAVITKMKMDELEQQNKRYREAFNSIMTLWKYSEDRTDFEWLAHKMSEEARKELEAEQ